MQRGAGGAPPAAQVVDRVVREGEQVRAALARRCVDASAQQRRRRRLPLPEVGGASRLRAAARGVELLVPRVAPLLGAGNPRAELGRVGRVEVERLWAGSREAQGRLPAHVGPAL